MGSASTVITVAAVFSILLSVLIAVASLFVFLRLRLSFIARINLILEKVNLVEARLKRQAYSDQFWNAVGKGLGLRDVTAENIKNERDCFSKTLANPDSVDVPKLPKNHYEHAAGDDPNYRTMAVVAQDCFTASKKSTNSVSVESSKSKEPLRMSVDPTKPSTESAKQPEQQEPKAPVDNGPRKKKEKSEKETVDYEAVADLHTTELLPPPPHSPPKRAL